MARNSVPEGADRTPIHLGEHLLTPGYGAEIQLKIPATIEGPKSSHSARGRVWLTDERIVFLGNKPGDEDYLFGVQYNTELHSLIIPYSTIRDNEFKVPLFNANNIFISFVPDITHRNPQLPDPGIGQYLTCKMLVDHGYGHNLWKRIEKERAVWVERNRAAEALRESGHGAVLAISDLAADDRPTPADVIKLSYFR